jgi:eukaryotic-like serine/threonine-protein kinase
VTDGLAAGRKVGPYRLLFRLGKGGMGEVWAASRDDSHLGFQKLIALKVLLNKEKDSNAAVMFFDEAKVTSVLQHHAIVPTVDLGGDGDVFYLAMEMVRGPSLTALLQRLVINRRTLTPSLVAHIGISIASALDYAQTRAAHEGRPLKLIHRDVSPHNVLLDLNGAVRLTDFGVARTAIQDHKSRVGTVRGKPSYMAPEQVVGGDIDGRTDIFSLGIVLYECACLKRLFGRSNPVKSMDAVLKHEPTPLPELVDNFPQPLWAVIQKALEKEPSKRLQSAREMVEGLTEAMRSLGGATTAQMDLVALIEKNFEPDAFDIESKVQIALAEAGIEIDGPPRDPTVAGRARDVPDTQIVWPTAYAPDPLAPEAIEQARTQFRALTPSASVAMQMQTPAVDFTPMSQSFMGQVPRQRSWLLPLVALVIAAVVVTMVAVVVVQRNGPPAVEIAEAEHPQVPPPPAPMIEARKEAPAVRSAPKVQPPPPQPVQLPPPVETPAKKVKPPKNDPTPPPADRSPEQAPTFKEVHTMIKQLRAIDEEQGKKMYVTLLEVGSNDPKRLAELRTKVKAALETKK